MNIISNAATLMTNVLSARAERIAATPGSEEEVQPKGYIELHLDDPEDRIEISRIAQEMQKLEEMRKTAPRIDWENRTFMGQKIPDTWHKEPTPEMIAGEQPYVISTGLISGERKYIEQALPERERVILNDMQFLQGMQQHVEKAESMMKTYEARRQEHGMAPDPVSQAILQRHSDDMKKEMQSFLEMMVIGYDKLGFDLNYADEYMRTSSLGTFDLAALLEKYFGAE